MNYIDKYFENIDNLNTPMTIWLKGHLFIEHFLKQLIIKQSPELEDFLSELNFYRIVSLAKGLKCIDKNQAEAIIEINRIRNKFAHNLDYKITKEDYLQVLNKSTNAFSDFTDGLEQSLCEINEHKNIEDCDVFIFIELFLQILYDLDYHEYNKTK